MAKAGKIHGVYTAEPSNEQHTTYSLLELPKELLALCESWKEGDAAPFEIKGEPDDETCLVTRSQTYSVKAVRNSNTLLLCFPRDGGLEIAATLRQSLEVARARPKTERLSILEGQEYSNEDASLKPSKRLRRYAKSEIENLIQASELEIQHVLREKRIIEVDGYLRPISKSFLLSTLAALLLVLATNNDLSLLSVTTTLAQDVELPENIAAQIVNLFLIPGKDEVEPLQLVNEIGKLLLDPDIQRQRNIGKQKIGTQQRTIAVSDFMAAWANLTGEEVATLCKLENLKGNYILEGQNILPINVAYLPLDPPTRFNHLFSLRSKWLPEDIIPFMAGIGVDDKEREKWLLKCARKIKEGKTTFYVARSTT